MAMGMKGLLVLTLGLAMAATSSAVLYKVGDNSGWTILGNINYTDWTSKKTFHVGDIIGKFISLLSRSPKINPTILWLRAEFYMSIIASFLPTCSFSGRSIACHCCTHFLLVTCQFYSRSTPF